MSIGFDTAQHKIRRVIFDLRFPNEGVAFRERRKMESVFNSTIMPALEKVFYAYSANGQTLWIDQLEIDLGLIDLEFLSVNAVEGIIRAQLDGRLRLLDSEINESAQDESRIMTAIITFLRMGYWAWDSPFQQVEALEKAIQGLDEPLAQQVRRVILGAMRTRTVRLRIAQQFQHTFIDWLIPWLTSDEEAQVIQTVTAGIETSDVEVLRTVQLALTLQVSEYGAVDVERLIQQAIEERDELLALRAATDPDIKEIMPWSQREEPDSPDITLLLRGSEHELLLETRVEESALKQGFYVHNAGIVLLHPYIERFFEHLGLLDERQNFHDLAALYRGVHILHFIATGKDSPQEHETILCKFLCGLIISHPIPRHVDLSQADFVEIENLLQSVIGHWQKLKNTSIDALRESFLQREGKLLKEAAVWKLIVEQRSLDMLLDYLPWTVSKVHLAWMDAVLVVDWM